MRGRRVPGREFGGFRRLARGIDQYGSRASRLLCKACTDEYKQLVAKQDAEFQQFMARKG